MTDRSPYETLVERLISVAVLYDKLVPPRSMVNAILSEIASAGLQIVPKEPTEEMCEAAGAIPTRPIAGYITRAISAALSAAPDYHGGGK